MPSVVVHSADWCKPCQELKKLLREEGIPFTVVDWTRKILHADLPVLPMTVVNGQEIIGCNVEAIKKALDNARNTP